MINSLRGIPDFLILSWTWSETWTLHEVKGNPAWPLLQLEMVVCTILSFPCFLKVTWLNAKRARARPGERLLGSVGRGCARGATCVRNSDSGHAPHCCPTPTLGSWMQHIGSVLLPPVAYAAVVNCICICMPRRVLYLYLCASSGIVFALRAALFVAPQRTGDAQGENGEIGSAQKEGWD